jgi:hypothetical protein
MRKLAVALVAAFIVWTGVWFWVANAIETMFSDWVTASRANGTQITHGPVSISGFPIAWHLQILKPELSVTAPFMSWRGDEVVAKFHRPWPGGEVPLEFPGQHVLSVGTGSAAYSGYLQAMQPDGWAWIDASGVAEVGVDLRQLEARAQPHGPAAQVARARASFRPNPSMDGAPGAALADITLDLTDLTLPHTPPGGLGREVARVVAELKPKGRAFRLPLPQAVAMWRDAGGTIEVERSTVVWGPLTVDANGTLALDDKNRPIGAGVARIRGFVATIEALAEGGLMTATQATSMKITLNLLSRPVGEGLGRELELPLTAQNGRLYGAGIPLMPVWPLKLE